MNGLPPERTLLNKAYQVNKELSQAGNKSWLYIIDSLSKYLQTPVRNKSKNQIEHLLQNLLNNKMKNTMDNIKVATDSKLTLYSYTFDQFNIADYLTLKIGKKKRSLITKLRISSHCLNYETGTEV